jgi:heat shock protein HslJ
MRCNGFYWIAQRTCAMLFLAAVFTGCAAPTSAPPAAPPAQSGVGATMPRAAAFENTYWKLMRLRGSPVPLSQQQREPHLILQPAQKRVVGFSGCNRMGGNYTLESDRIVFTNMVSTRMACMQGDDVERGFLNVLSAVARWRVSGERMELLDASGTVLAQFESRSMQ